MNNGSGYILNRVSVKIFARTLDRNIHTCLLIERPLEHGVRSEKRSRAVPALTTSMMSNSPLPAHVPYGESVGSIQTADHRPPPSAAWRASTLPCLKSNLFAVRILAEV